MRGAPGRTERTLGFALLVLVVVVAMAFGVTSGLFGERVARSSLSWAIKSAADISDQPLFAVKRSSLPPSVSHEMQVLHQLFPAEVGGRTVGLLNGPKTISPDCEVGWALR